MLSLQNAGSLCSRRTSSKKNRTGTAQPASAHTCVIVYTYWLQPAPDTPTRKFQINTCRKQCKAGKAEAASAHQVQGQTAARAGKSTAWAEGGGTAAAPQGSPWSKVLMLCELCMAHCAKTAFTYHPTCLGGQFAKLVSPGHEQHPDI